MSLIDEIRQREYELWSSPGGRVAFGIDALSATHRLLQRNAVELTDELASITGPRKMEEWKSARRFDITQIWGDREPEEFHEEIVRLMHNFLASVKTLVDHTRNLVRDLWGKDSDFEKGDYAEAKKRYLTSHGTIIFMQELRNYALHYQRIPVGTSTLQQPDGTLDNVTFLDTAVLLEWHGWRKSIRESLIHRRIPIPVRVVVDEYMSRANDLYDWFHAATLNQHADSLREYHEGRRRYREWLKQQPHNEIFAPTEGWVVYADNEPPMLSGNG
jgi:hypothetical protein